MLIRYFNMLIKPFALGGQLHSLVAAGKERAAKLCFKVFNCSGQIRLAVKHQLCRLGYIAVFRNIIKHTVIIIAYIHFLHAPQYQNDIIIISIIYFTYVDKMIII